MCTINEITPDYNPTYHNKLINNWLEALQTGEYVDYFEEEYEIDANDNHKIQLTIDRKTYDTYGLVIDMVDEDGETECLGYMEGSELFDFINEVDEDEFIEYEYECDECAEIYGSEKDAKYCCDYGNEDALKEWYDNDEN